MKKKTAKKQKRAHSLKPQNIDGDTWYYEEANGLRVVHWTTGGAGRVALEIWLPWRKVAASLKRHQTFI